MKIRTQASVVLILVCSMLLALPVFADAGDPPNRVVRLGYMDGAVSFEPSGENNWSQATLNYPLTTGDRLWTDQGARAELETGNLAIRLSEQTDLTTTNVSDQVIQLGLAQGTLRIRPYEIRSGSEIEVDTPNAAVTITQPGNYRIDTYPDQNTTVVTVNSGELQITGNTINQLVEAGQAVQLSGTDQVQVTSVEVPGSDAFDQWADQRDARYLNSRSRRYVSPYVAGYSDLDQYGNWDTVPEYGAVWYPSSVPGGWAPYRYGRWAWVEPWGWTWVDESPWGFAPFHYGRWVQIGPRWGWLPGPIAAAPIYGPAFVAFVGGGGFSIGFGGGSVAAWFPLGPGEPYYPSYHHSDNYLRQVNVTNVNTTNITNITNITNVTNVNNINYRYKTVATTAVPVSAFQSAQPVARSMLKVSPQQIAKAQVVPHPEVNPAPRAIVAGTPATHPPVAEKRPAVIQHAPVASTATAKKTPPPAAGAKVNIPPRNTADQPSRNEPAPPARAVATPPDRTPAGSAHTNSPPAAEKNVPQPPNTTVAEASHTNPPAPAAPANTNSPSPAERNTPQPPNRNAEPARPAPPANAERPNPPSPVRPPAPPAAANRPGPPPERPALVSKAPPPPERPNFQQRAPAMQQHPGRPLEPQQRQNITEGRPAGPMQDREVPPHAAAPPPAHPAAPPKKEPGH